MQLKLKTKSLQDRCSIIQVGGRDILITDFLNRNLVNNFRPDMVLLTGIYPKTEKEISLPGSVKFLIISSEVSSSYRLPDRIYNSKADTVHFVRKSGALRVQL